MALTPFVFHRPALAETIIAGLTGEGLADYSSGLFLAAPRRTGKSTFLKSDLVPACQSRGWLPVYVDLWVDRLADPGAVIEAGIMEALRDHQGLIKKAIKASGVDSVSILHMLSVHLNQDSLPEHTTLSDALQALHIASGQLVVLIIDEAQHALNTERGVNAMFALKAARDAMNLGEQSPGLRLIFTGSSRDKLAQLVLARDQPFFGTTVTPFPLLGNDFVQAFTDNLNTKLAPSNALKFSDMKRAFGLVGHRPELLRQIVHNVALDLGQAPNLGEMLEQGAFELQAGVFAEYEAAYNLLTPVQKGILEAMALSSSKRQSFPAFSDETLRVVREVSQTLGGPEAPGIPSIQSGLAALREKGLVWKSGRGAYALEDSGMTDWLISARVRREA